MRRALRRFRHDARGIAALEFAILAPLLILMLGTTVEIGRILIAYRSLEQVTTGIAHHVARFPEYEKRARDYAPAIARAMLPAAGVANLSLSVTSLTNRDGALGSVFPTHILLGSDPKIDWKDYLSSSTFVDGQSVIFVAAVYSYRPLFLASSLTLQLRKTVTLMPAFSRAYPWNDSVSPDKYVY